MKPLEELADSPPVRKLLNMLFILCMKEGVGELHIEPLEERLTIVKGDVREELVSPPGQLFWGLIARLRIMAGLDVKDIGTAQWEELELEIGGQPYRVIVTAKPVLGGEDLIVTFQPQVS
jgi:type II secretory ATPase GspE/PulE/Tfp pilus assembly ATPase PilB-like protein